MCTWLGWFCISYSGAGSKILTTHIRCVKPLLIVLAIGRRHLAKTCKQEPMFFFPWPHATTDVCRPWLMLPSIGRSHLATMRTLRRCTWVIAPIPWLMCESLVVAPSCLPMLLCLCSQATGDVTWSMHWNHYWNCPVDVHTIQLMCACVSWCCMLLANVSF